MKRKPLLIIILTIMLIAMIPIPQHLKDGGSIEYKALIYRITKYRRLNDSSIEKGISIDILGMKVYDSMQPDIYESKESPKSNETQSRIIRVDGELYEDTGKESTLGPRCGNMDGEITSNTRPNEIPTFENQSNFEGRYGYQIIDENTIELLINDKWIVFKKR
ncbi:MAG TPA: hypothetical protein DCY94_03290 [Firmicutes bacterium]|nr:hypothetical protein [Bacillota bacterium]